MWSKLFRSLPLILAILTPPVGSMRITGARGHLTAKPIQVSLSREFDFLSPRYTIPSDAPVGRGAADRASAS
jgi:hypothetical protein